MTIALDQSEAGIYVSGHLAADGWTDFNMETTKWEDQRWFTYYCIFTRAHSPVMPPATMNGGPIL